MGSRGPWLIEKSARLLFNNLRSLKSRASLTVAERRQSGYRRGRATVCEERLCQRKGVSCWDNPRPVHGIRAVNKALRRRDRFQEQGARRSERGSVHRYVTERATSATQLLEGRSSLRAPDSDVRARHAPERAREHTSVCDRVSDKRNAAIAFEDKLRSWFWVI